MKDRRGRRRRRRRTSSRSRRRGICRRGENAKKPGAPSEKYLRKRTSRNEVNEDREKKQQDEQEKDANNG